MLGIWKRSRFQFCWCLPAVELLGHMLCALGIDLTMSSSVSSSGSLVSEAAMWKRTEPWSKRWLGLWGNCPWKKLMCFSWDLHLFSQEGCSPKNKAGPSPALWVPDSSHELSLSHKLHLWLNCNILTQDFICSLHLHWRLPWLPSDEPLPSWSSF